MKIEVNIEKKYVFLIVGFILVIAGFFLIRAYGTSNPVVFGHSASEIDGLNDTINQTIRGGIVDDYILEVVGGPVNCNLIYSSANYGCGAFTGCRYSVEQTPGWVSIPMDPSCKSDEGCLIRQEIYKTNGLALRRQCDYSQDSSTGVWWSSCVNSGSFKNGDGTSSPIVPNYASGSIRLADDNNAAETDGDHWSFYDNNGNYGQRIYICTYS